MPHELSDKFQVQELVIDYTDCTTTGAYNASYTPIPANKISKSFKTNNVNTTSQFLWRHNNITQTPAYGVDQPNTPTCYLQFTIPNDIGSPVYLYYRLTNFYQNHRRYVKSLDLDQLKGQYVSNDTISGSACNPLKLNSDGKAYYPCGLIANSIFNDTIRSPTAVSTSGGQNPEPYSMTTQGIAWSSDLDIYQKTVYNNSEVAPPPNWQLRFPDGYTTQNPIPDLHTYEEFAVWMRTAGLPTFSKLALRNDNQTMRAGTYEMEIGDCKYHHSQIQHVLTWIQSSM